MRGNKNSGYHIFRAEHKKRHGLGKIEKEMKTFSRLGKVFESFTDLERTI